MSIRRVISLSPSCTEIVCALGAADLLVGKSHLCDYPAEIVGRPVCTAPILSADGADLSKDTATLQADETQIESLQPDLILSDWPRKTITGLKTGRSIVGTAPEKTPDIWSNIQSVAEALGMSEPGRVLLGSLKSRFVDIISQTCVFKNRTEVVCIDSVEPLTTAGFWMPELVEFAGGQALFACAGKPSQSLSWTALEHANPEVILLMPQNLDLASARRAVEPLTAHPQWRKLSAVRSKKVFVADSRHFLTRPGPRLVESLQLLAEVLHPKTFQFGGENKRWQRF